MLDTIAWYTPLILTVSLLIVTRHYSDWKNWRTYYPTILFINLVSLFAYILTVDNPLWLYHETFVFPNRMIHEFRLVFFVFPAIILLYLTFYPYKTVMLKQLGYIILWVLPLSIVEVVFVLLKIITFHNGWNIGWSGVIWFIIFPVIAIHHKKPIWVWLICAVFSVFVINYFNLPFLDWSK